MKFQELNEEAKEQALQDYRDEVLEASWASKMDAQLKKEVADIGVGCLKVDYDSYSFGRDEHLTLIEPKMNDSSLFLKKMGEIIKDENLPSQYKGKALSLEPDEDTDDQLPAILIEGEFLDSGNVLQETFWDFLQTLLEKVEESYEETFDDESVIAAIVADRNIEFDERGNFIKPKKGDGGKKTLSLTGTFDVPRKELEKKLKEGGFDVVSLSGKTEVLLVGEKTASPKKITKAEQAGIRIIRETDSQKIISLIYGGGEELAVYHDSSTMKVIIVGGRKIIMGNDCEDDAPVHIFDGAKWEGYAPRDIFNNDYSLVNDSGDAAPRWVDESFDNAASLNEESTSKLPDWVMEKISQEFPDFEFEDEE